MKLSTIRAARAYATALLASIFALHDASGIKAEGENSAPE